MTKKTAIRSRRSSPPPGNGTRRRGAFDPALIEAMLTRDEIAKHAANFALPDGPTVLMLRDGEPIAKYFQLIAQALQAIGRDDVLLLVVRDFDNLSMVDRGRMRRIGWIWADLPREIDRDDVRSVELATAQANAAIRERNTRNAEASDATIRFVPDLLPEQVEAVAEAAYTEALKLRGILERIFQLHPDLRTLMPKEETADVSA